MSADAKRSGIIVIQATTSTCKGCTMTNAAAATATAMSVNSSRRKKQRMPLAACNITETKCIRNGCKPKVRDSNEYASTPMGR